MSLKMEFVEKASRPGAAMAELCREYEISRETGYKWLKRFKVEGYVGLEERSRAPQSSPLAKAEALITSILDAREAYPRWGAKKLWEVLRRTHGQETPSRGTIARVLKRYGQVREKRRKRPLSMVERAPQIEAKAPNDVWTVDFKGWWRSLDGLRCEPLTVRDSFSRYVLAVVVLEGTSAAPVREVFETLFRKHGLPATIQCDNGAPFISSKARGGLTKLSAWWVSLGIHIVRSRPGCPQDNGGHERMHRDIRADLQAFPETTRQAQQQACAKWKQQFNHVRPHEALGGNVPAEIYKPSARRSLVPPRHSYPSHWLVRQVSPSSGTVAIDSHHYTVSTALGGLRVALEPIGGLRHRIWLRDMQLGEIELAPPTRMIDSLVDIYLERPLTPSARRARRSASHSTPNPQLPSLPPDPPQLPNETCSQQTLGSSAVSPAASEVQPA